MGCVLGGEQETPTDDCSSSYDCYGTATKGVRWVAVEGFIPYLQSLRVNISAPDISREDQIEALMFRISHLLAPFLGFSPVPSGRSRKDCKALPLKVPRCNMSIRPGERFHRMPVKDTNSTMDRFCSVAIAFQCGLYVIL